MNVYSLPMIPGPTSVPKEFLEAYQTNYGSADLEPEFLSLYAETQDLLRQLLQTRNQAAIMSGEGMAALWGALKSVIRPGDRVLAVSSGLFGSGFGDMAKSCGAEVRVLEGAPGDCPDPEAVRKAALEFRPRMITAVHCETPSGILNPIEPLGSIAHETGALFCVDFVASAGGAPVFVDDWHIDLGLLGSQKCLSLIPDLAMVTVSPAAWEAIEETGYQGYDALAPWRHALEEGYFPYTPNWHSMAALRLSLQALMAEGLENLWRRHAETALYCREGLARLGIRTYPAREELNSPTVTAALVPQGWIWPDLDRELRKRGAALGGTFGPLAGKIFRIGHMGSQAHQAMVDKALAALEDVLKS